MKQQTRHQLFFFLNSFSYILLAFLTVFFISRVVMALTALSFDIPSVLKLDGLAFTAQQEDWWFDSVISVFLSRVLSYLVIGILSYIIYLKSAPYKGYLKIYFIWLAFFSGLLFVGEIFLGNILKDGVYHALAWLYVGDTFRLIIIIIMVIVYLLVSTLFSKAFVVSANIYFTKFNADRLRQFFVYQLFVPYLVFLLLLTALLFYNFPVILMASLYIGVIMFIIILYNSGQHAKMMNIEEEPGPVMFDYRAFLTALFAMIFYIVFLSKGIHFS